MKNSNKKSHIWKFIICIFVILFYFPKSFATANTILATDWSFKQYKTLQEARLANFSSIFPIERTYQGFIEYKAIFSLPNFTDKEEIGIYLGRIGDVDKVYINGTLIGQTGAFPPNYSNSMDVTREYLIPKNLLNVNSNNEIKILAYVEYTSLKGVKTSNVVIGKHSELQYKKYVADIFWYSIRTSIPILCLVLAILSFPWLAPQELRAKQVLLFLLAVACFSFGLCRSRILFHFMDILLVYKITLISSILSTFFISLYTLEICELRKKVFSYPLIFIVASFLAAILIQSKFMPLTKISLWWFPFEAILVVATTFLAFLKLKRQEYWVKFGLLILSVFVLNDTLRDMRLINTQPLLDLGFGSFVVMIIANQILNLKFSWMTFSQRELELEAEARVGRLATQLAHDIHSPVATLSILTNSANSFSEETHPLIQEAIIRIRDIANSLLDNYKSIKSTNIQSIGNAINSIVTEKKLQLISSKKILISARTDNLPCNIFTKIKMIELKRILSNLINNSIEAIEENGYINIELIVADNYCAIKIKDNGKGVPKEILPRLMKKGFSYGKKCGNGLGLYYAKNTIESWGGEISIVSQQLRKETEILISLPCAETCTTH